ncbi:MAG: tRNA (adenosine(37)-N6)-dimethylallyltransferase MiaA, partial [Oscillospiraceae bacterium]|nr:tRNA (adenosine(37)-N6)-dimethylallyltransferase MiaA [Oscillospiraceae bacterium]
MEDKKIPIIVIVGPTASGKTALSISLAKKYNAEIVSADSMQVYKGMDIATAKPSDEEKQGIKHHLIDCVDIDRKFSVAEYLQDARKAIDDIHSRNKKVIVAGGTGLYVNSLVDNIQFEAEEQNELRTSLNQELSKLGGAFMLERLRVLDPEYAQTLHENDHGRIIRGIEINTLFNHSVKEHKKLSRAQDSPYNAIMLGITYRDRQKLYN